MEEFSIVFIVFGSTFGVIFAIAFFIAQYHRKKLDTVVKIVEHGGEVQPDLLEKLSGAGGPAADLRKGLIWLAVGIPLTLAIGVNEGWEEALFGGIPLFIGVAYLIVMKLGHNGS